jgi:hypothetical protein
VLVENHGHLVGKEQLLKAVWPDSVVEEGNLAHNLAVLRKGLGEKQSGEQYIQTVPARGYRFGWILGGGSYKRGCQETFFPGRLRPRMLSCIQPQATLTLCC